MGDEREVGDTLAFADRLDERLRTLGLNQTELARRSDVSLSYISRLVRGQIRNPTLEVLRKLSEALDMRLEELAGGSPSPPVKEISSEPAFVETSLEPIPILGRPVSDPRAFFGREGLIRSMRRLWSGRTMQHALLSGPPQSGKTSILLCLKNAGQLSPAQWSRAFGFAQPEYLAVHHADLWRSSNDPIEYVYASFGDPQLTLSQPAELVAEILHQLGMEPGTVADDGDDRAILLDFVKKIRSLKDRRVVWLFDDVDRMLASVDDSKVFGEATPQHAERSLVGDRFREFAPLFLRACRTLGSDDRISLAFVMTCTWSLDSTFDLEKDASSPFFGLVCHKFTLGPLDRPAAIELTNALLMPVRGADAAAPVTERIVERSHGWPYLIQRLCQAYLSASTRDDGTYAPAEPWDAQRVLDHDPYAHRLLTDS